MIKEIKPPPHLLKKRNSMADAALSDDKYMNNMSSSGRISSTMYVNTPACKTNKDVENVIVIPRQTELQGSDQKTMSVGRQTINLIIERE